MTNYESKAESMPADNSKEARLLLAILQRSPAAGSASAIGRVRLPPCAAAGTGRGSSQSKHSVKGMRGRQGWHRTHIVESADMWLVKAN